VYLKFRNGKGRIAEGSRLKRVNASACQISSRSVKPLLRYGDFYFFVQDSGRLPSWICDARVWTTNEGHLVVFITVQNLVGIDRVVLIVCKV